jgi:DNA ligase (NAD+)
MARDAGAHVASSVSKNTHFVVVGSDAGTKRTEAEKLGVPILSEEEFLQYLAKNR